MNDLAKRTEATCKKCGATKPASEFYPSQFATRVNPPCKACRAVMEKARNAGGGATGAAQAPQPALPQPMTAAPATPGPLCLTVGTYIIPLASIAGIIVDERGAAEVTMIVQETRGRDGIIAPMAWSFNATEWAARAIMPFAESIGCGVSVSDLQREIAALSDALKEAQRDAAAANRRAQAMEQSAENARAMAQQMLQAFSPKIAA